MVDLHEVSCKKVNGDGTPLLETEVVLIAYRQEI